MRFLVLVSGFRFRLRGFWCMVPGVWFLVVGVWLGSGNWAPEAEGWPAAGVGGTGRYIQAAPC